MSKGDSDPERCGVCGQWRTVDVAYAGRRCTCADGPLCQAYLALCSACPMMGTAECQPERCDKTLEVTE